MSKNMLLASPLPPLPASSVAAAESGRNNRSSASTSSSSHSSRSSSEIDIVFLTYWAFPTPVEDCVLETLERKLSSRSRRKEDIDAGVGSFLDVQNQCVRQLSLPGYQRPMRRRRSASFSSSFSERRRSRRTATRRRLGDDDDGIPSFADFNFQNPFAIEMGELRVRRLKLTCSCKNSGRQDDECIRLLPLNKQNK